MDQINGIDLNQSVRFLGRGLFAHSLMDSWATLPVEEEGRLGNPTIRDRWMERVVAYHQLQQLWNSQWKAIDLQRFHARHQATLRTRSIRHCHELEKLLAQDITQRLSTIKDRYETVFMAAHAIPAPSSPSSGSLKRSR